MHTSATAYCGGPSCHSLLFFTRCASANERLVNDEHAFGSVRVEDQLPFWGELIEIQGT